MIHSDEKMVVYLNSVVNSVFKVLPLYEEENVGIKIYIESLLFELEGLQDVVKVHQTSEYVSLLSTLASLKREITKPDSKKATIKREVFKSIDIIKNMIKKIEDGMQ